MMDERERSHDAYLTSLTDWEADARRYMESADDEPDQEEADDDPGGVPDPTPDDEPHGHWHVLHPLTGWQRRWHLNHFGDGRGHHHEAHGLGVRV